MRRLFFGGGSAPIATLTMIAKSGYIFLQKDFGYNYSIKSCSITPSSITYKGVEYRFKFFYSITDDNYTLLRFWDDKMPEGDKITIRVNGVIYTLLKEPEKFRYGIYKIIFPSAGTYTIEILSIR